jgi:hypothetical protein
MKLGRNELCFCGSGQKYKKCCLNKDETREREAVDRAGRPENVMGGKATVFNHAIERVRAYDKKRRG